MFDNITKEQLFETVNTFLALNEGDDATENLILGFAASVTHTSIEAFTKDLKRYNEKEAEMTENKKIMTFDDVPIEVGKTYYLAATTQSYIKEVKVERINTEDETVVCFVDLTGLSFRKEFLSPNDLFANKETAAHEWDRRCQLRLKAYAERLGANTKLILNFPFGEGFFMDYCKRQAYRNAVIRTFGFDPLDIKEV